MGLAMRVLRVATLFAILGSSCGDAGGASVREPSGGAAGGVGAAGAPGAGGAPGSAGARPATGGIGQGGAASFSGGAPGFGGSHAGGSAGVGNAGGANVTGAGNTLESTGGTAGTGSTGGAGGGGRPGLGGWAGAGNAAGSGIAGAAAGGRDGGVCAGYPSNYIECPFLVGGSDICVNPATNRSNCGSCGHACKAETSTAAGELCQSGTCVPSCNGSDDPGGCFIWFMSDGGGSAAYCNQQPKQAGSDVYWLCRGGVPFLSSGAPLPGATSCTCSYPN